jgi:hypothetical protein
VVCHRADAARPAQQDPVAVVGRRYGAIRSHAESKCEIPAREGAADLAELQLDLPGLCAAEEDTFDFFRRAESPYTNPKTTRIILIAEHDNLSLTHFKSFPENPCLAKRCNAQNVPPLYHPLVTPVANRS